ncbi:MAG: hypothetical protein KF805_05695 [Phycisphaeraceae bacterium]|nr:hypothetical protein [Phycisphaeraceae bacterium]
MTTSPATSETPATGFNPFSGIAALIVPGLGHVFLGQFRRGALVAVGVLGLFFAGLLVGGIDCVDSKEDALWFIAQAPTGVVAFGTNYVHQNRFKGVDPSSRAAPRRMPYPGEHIDANGVIVPGGHPPAQRSLARVHEMGILFTAVAGLLNVLAAIDAMFPTIGRKS